MSELCYGQLGRLDYDSNSHAWLPGRWPRLESIEAVSSVTTHIESSSTTAEQDRAGKQSLARCFPQTGCSLGYLRGLLTFNLKQSDQDQSLSLQSGDRLASVDFGPAGHARTETLFAFARGFAGEEVGIILAQNTHSGWSPHYNHVLQTSSPLQKDLCVWNPGYGRVQQIVLYADAEGSRKSLIAVRYPSAFIIGCVAERPGWLRKASTILGWRPSPTARMDFLVVGRCMDLKTTKDMTDLTFNPNDTSEIATAHGDGSIKIWSRPLHRGRKHDEDPVFQLMTPHRTLYAANDQNIDEVVAKNWIKIFWTGNAVYIAALSRSKVVVYHITTGKAFDQTNQLIQEGEVVLDAKPVPSEPSHLVLVTNSRLLWLALEVQGMDTLSAHRHPYLMPLSSWKHCRDPTDLTLKVTIRQSVSARPNHADAANVGVKSNPEDAPKAIEVLLLSRLTHLMTQYTFQYGAGNAPLKFISAVDPASWFLQAFARTGCLADVLSFTCPFTEDDNNSHQLDYSPDIGKEYLDRGFRFSQIFTLDERFSLSSTIVCHKSNAGKTTQEMKMLNWSELVPLIDLGKRKYRKRQKESDCFIVDEEESESVHLFRDVTRAIVSSFCCLGQPNNNGNRTGDARSVSNAAAYDFLHRDSSRNRKQLGIVLRDFATGASSTNENYKGSGTLWQCVHATAPKLDDIEAADAALTQLTASATSQANVGAQNTLIESVGLSMSNTLQDAGKSSPTTPFSDLYQQCVENWLAPLSPAFPGATRLARERILREVATAMCLSDWRVVSQPQVTYLETQNDMGDRTEESPPSSPPERALPTPPQTLQIEAAPLSLSPPTAEATAGTHQKSNSDSNSVDAALSRLARYCNIPTPSTTMNTPASSSSILQKVLASWNTPTDRTSTPATSHIDPTNPSSTTITQPSNNQQSRQKRRHHTSPQDRTAINQRKRPRLYDHNHNRNQDPTPLMTASSPSPPPTRTTHTHHTLTPQQTQQEQAQTLSLGLSASQDAAGTQDRPPAGPMVASQVEAGRFGGRAVGMGRGRGLPLRKKVRKPGF